MLSTKLRAVSLAALVAFLGCNSSGVSETKPADQARAPSDTPRDFTVTQSHAALNAPSFVWLARSDWPSFESADVAAKEIAKAVAPTFHLSAKAAATLEAPVVHDNGHGPIIARYAQRLEGVDIFRGGLNVVMSRTFEPVAASGLVAANISRSAKGFQRDAAAALGIAHQALTGETPAFGS